MLPALGILCLSALIPTGCRVACPSTSGVCGCQSGGCDCGPGNGCGEDGTCYPCSFWDCRAFPPNSGCKCNTGTLCSASGTCTMLENHQLTGDHPNCVGHPCNNLGFSDFIDGRCVCKCSTGYTGTSCNMCSDGKAGWPSCSSVGEDCPEDYCNHHGVPYFSTTFGVCLCSCSDGFDGDRCTSCSSDVGLYPSCASNVTYISESTSSSNDDYLIPTVVCVAALVFVLFVALIIVWNRTKGDDPAKEEEQKDIEADPANYDPYARGGAQRNPIDTSFPGK